MLSVVSDGTIQACPLSKGANVICPICGKEAKTTGGLRKHLSGTRPYGGHELTPSEAQFTVAGLSAAGSLEQPDPDSYLEEALKNLVASKKLPKYQFERCVDAFLGVFLPEIVGATLGSRSVKLVAQEFPIKKAGSNQSTNVDYVLNIGGRGPRPWVFLELKTDPASMKDSQALIYAKRLGDATMTELLADVVQIQGVSSKVSKYQALLDLFPPMEAIRGSVQVVYLTPGETSAAELLPPTASDDLVSRFAANLTCISFGDLERMNLTKFPDAWSLFRTKVVPAVIPDA